MTQLIRRNHPYMGLVHLTLSIWRPWFLVLVVVIDHGPAAGAYGAPVRGLYPRKYVRVGLVL